MKVAMRYVLIAALILTADNNIPPRHRQRQAHLSRFPGFGPRQHGRTDQLVVRLSFRQTRRHSLCVGGDYKLRSQELHPNATLIETSERIINDIDRGI